MVVLEVSMPTGFTASNDNLFSLAQKKKVKKIETQNADSLVVLYFDNLNANEVDCFVFEGYRIHKIAELKPASVVVYDYYDSGEYL